MLTSGPVTTKGAREVLLAGPVSQELWLEKGGPTRKGHFTLMPLLVTCLLCVSSVFFFCFPLCPVS